MIRWNDVDEKSLGDGISLMLEDKIYQDNVDKLRELVMDQPLHPLEMAVWWMEYLLRHPGNGDMRSPVHNLAWYQYFLLDVGLVLVVGLLMLAVGIRAVVRCCWRRATRNKYKNE